MATKDPWQLSIQMLVRNKQRLQDFVYSILFCNIGAG